MAGPNIKGTISLTNLFSGPAAAMVSSVQRMQSSLAGLNTAVASAKSSMATMGKSMVGLFAASKLMHFGKEHAMDAHMVGRFDRMFDAVKDKIKVKKSEITKLVDELSLAGNLDPEDLLGKAVIPVIQSGKIQGGMVLRTLQAGANIAADKGTGTEGAIEETQKLSNMMKTKRGIIMAAKEYGIYRQEEIKAAVKALEKEKNLVGMQQRLMLGVEKMFGGSQKKVMGTELHQIQAMTQGVKELGEALGGIALAAGGKALGNTGLAFRRIGAAVEYAVQAAKNAEGVSLGKMFEIFTDEGNGIKTSTTMAAASLTAISMLLMTSARVAAGLLVSFIGLGPALALAAAAAGLLISQNWGAIQTAIDDLKSTNFGTLLSQDIDIVIGKFTGLIDTIKGVTSGILEAVAASDTWKSLDTMSDKIAGGAKDLYHSVTGTTAAKYPEIAGPASMTPLDTFKKTIEIGVSGFKDFAAWGSKKGDGTGFKYSPETAAMARDFNTLKDLTIRRATPLPEVAAASGTGIVDSIAQGMRDGLRGITDFLGISNSLEPRTLLSAEALAPLKVEPAQLDINNKVSGQININISDPSGRASVTSSSEGGVGLAVGKTMSGRYTSTNTAQPAAVR